MNILGLNAFHGDSSACLFVDGVMVAAVEEERFRRIKHWAGFPSESIRFCLDKQGLTLSDVDAIAINTDPKAARWKKIGFALSGKASMALVREKILVRNKRKGIAEHLSEAFPDQVFKGKVEYVEHHLAHFASAYSVSPYSEASIISVDGFGDFASAATGFGRAGELTIARRVHFPHSLGIFYQALTQYLGFYHYGDEYKVMGLAPYGTPRFADKMDEILHHTEDGLFELNLRYFQHHRSPIGYEWDNASPKVSQLFSDSLPELLGPIRSAEQELTQFHCDIARSIQDAYERAFFHMLNTMHKAHQTDNLTIAGGCGMNSVANGKVHLNTPYKNIYVQSAAGDAGGAIGAAVVATQRAGRQVDFDMSHSYWGPEYDASTIKSLLAANAAALEQQGCCVNLDVSDDELVDQVSSFIIDGQVIGWFQGAMEWGPRALGNRSILGDPRREDMKDILNLKIKRRESFRPFAPSVLREHVEGWFESDANVPFMMKVFQIKEAQRERIPAVAHVDGSGRLQTVTPEGNPLYYQLIQAFFKKTEVPMLLNTSFNENEPVVCTPQQALDCFLRTNMDVLVLGSQLITRTPLG
ncbi:carbamoyltransferase family protein [Arenicella xantha]|uniref:Carbamoyltransferase n=1 Tax=Arenicella xantha TaxID=644221 RepID=A0A395JHX0_9GAMM|nr:carbamoyltransferase C-terminal domain-containing protein [Arenicella xantha]RBP49179.1 carbamoyltransferase [Arenicella xantha]